MSAETVGTCPAWCAGAEDGPGRGEHADDKTFVPATGASRPSVVSVERGAAFPVLGVGLDWCEVDGAAGPSVVLRAIGVDAVEAELYLQPAGGTRTGRSGAGAPGRARRAAAVSPVTADCCPAWCMDAGQ